jgi:hypothetical protein
VGFEFSAIALAQGSSSHFKSARKKTVVFREWFGSDKGAGGDSRSAENI